MNINGGRGTVMAKRKNNSVNALSSGIEVSDMQIEIFARRLLPEIKRFFVDENIRQEFEEWQRKQQNENTEQ